MTGFRFCFGHWTDTLQGKTYITPAKWMYSWIKIHICYIIFVFIFIFAGYCIHRSPDDIIYGRFWSPSKFPLYDHIHSPCIPAWWCCVVLHVEGICNGRGKDSCSVDGNKGSASTMKNKEVLCWYQFSKCSVITRDLIIYVEQSGVIPENLFWIIKCQQNPGHHKTP